MRKSLLFIGILFVLASCQDQVQFNNPAVQGLKDNLIWKATYISAVQSPDGSLTMEAYQKNDILTLKTASTKAQVYTLGVNLSNEVIFVQKIGDIKKTFSTGIDRGDGQINITEYDSANNTITGTFRFNAINNASDPLAEPKVNFQQGVFYKVPISVTTK